MVGDGGLDGWSTVSWYIAGFFIFTLEEPCFEVVIMNYQIIPFDLVSIVYHPRPFIYMICMTTHLPFRFSELTWMSTIQTRNDYTRTISNHTTTTTIYERAWMELMGILLPFNLFWVHATKVVGGCQFFTNSHIHEQTHNNICKTARLLKCACILQP